VALPSQGAIQFKPNPTWHSGNGLFDIYWLTHAPQTSQNSGTVHVFVSFLLVFCEFSASFYAFIKLPNHNYGYTSWMHPKTKLLNNSLLTPTSF
jgi:hypothetical protein